MAKIVKANKGTKSSSTDVVFTPDKVAKFFVKYMSKYIKATDVLLEPCKGGGAFYKPLRSLGNKVYWCEISAGKDFFKFKKHVNWIITNPPYSIYDSFVQHCFEVSDNVCLLIPLSKLVSSLGRIKSYSKYGGIKLCYIIGASKCGFPFGFPCVFVWFKKGYKKHLIKWKMDKGEI